MTAPLFIERDPCGCERGLGHVCRVPFAEGDDWPGNITPTGELHGRNWYDKGDNCTKMSPRPRERPGDATTTVRSVRNG